MQEVKEKAVEIEKVKITKSGPRYYFHIPASFIKYKFLDPDKTYTLQIFESPKSDSSSKSK